MSTTTAANSLLGLLQGQSGEDFASSKTGWDDSTPVCDWQGISCDEDSGEVVGINVAGGGLKGTIPDTFASSLPKLQSIFMGSNHLNGTAPMSLFQLTDLNELDLSYNALSGSLPNQALASGTNLQTFNVAHNQFDGTLSSIISNGLDQVKLFDIKYNRLEGTIPDLSQGMPSLEDLDLSNNLFDGEIPTSLGRFARLKRLALSNNFLSGTIPLALTNDTLVLEELHAHGNLLSGTLPAALADLPELRVLFIDENKLTGTVPPQICDMDLNEAFFDGASSSKIDIDSTYEELYPERVADSDESATTTNNGGDGDDDDGEGRRDRRKLPTVQAAARSQYPPQQPIQPREGRSATLTPFLRREQSSMMALPTGSSSSTSSLTPSTSSKQHHHPHARRHRRRRHQRRRSRDLQSSRQNDPTSSRDGCTSVACPAGFQSAKENNKDGVFPCVPCEAEALNPYIGANRCFEVSQEHVLKTLWESTNGPTDWTGALDWGDDAVPVCRKDGVSCTDGGLVSGIVLRGKGLTGTLPPDVGFLSRLTVFDVRDNDIGGVLPADLHFAPLESLDISNNAIVGVVPIPLCQKQHLNGNGLDGVYTCDTVACRVGTKSSTGRAQPGASGEKCRACKGDWDHFLGGTTCKVELDIQNGITPFGLVGEIAIGLLGLGIMVGLCWVWKRSKVQRQYIQDRAYHIHGPGKEEQERLRELAAENGGDDGVEQFHDSDPLAGIDDIGGALTNLEVKVKDEWSSGKETQREVWLDVPKIR